jgi:hypothetical protein
MTMRETKKIGLSEQIFTHMKEIMTSGETNVEPYGT